MTDDELQARVDVISAQLRNARLVLEGLPAATAAARADRGWLFSQGQQVRVNRNRKVLMVVEEQPFSEGNATEYYVCTPDPTQADSHGRGKSTRYFREDDLVAA